MSSTDCDAEGVNTVNESTPIVPDPYLRGADQGRAIEPTLNMAS